MDKVKGQLFFLLLCWQFFTQTFCCYLIAVCPFTKNRYKSKYCITTFSYLVDEQ